MKTKAFNKFAPALVLLSAVMFSFGGLFIKLIPWQPLSINSARNIIAVVITAVYMKASGHKFVFNKTVLLSGLAMAYTTSMFCVSTKMTTAANAILLQFTSPVFVILFCWMFWKQRPMKRDIIMCITVFIGIGCFSMKALQRVLSSAI